MDRLLNAIASGLNIRSHNRSEEVIQKARKKFISELEKHLFSKLENLEVGQCITYSFNYENISETIIEKVNNNMKEVLLKLPALEKGERYIFPQDTYFSFKLTDRIESGGTVVINGISSWIIENI